MKNFSKIWDDIRSGTNIDIYFTVLGSFFVVVLGILQVVDETIVSSAILACLALVSMSLLANRRESEKLKEDLKLHKFKIDSAEILEALSSSSNSVIQALDGVKVTTFADRQAYTRYRTEQLRKATKVDDVTWRFQGLSTQTYSRGDIDAKREELDIISQIVNKPKVVWRGVAVFSSLEHFEREKSLITDPSNIGYNFGVYDFDSRGPLPLVGYMIIDDRELLIAYPHKSIRLAISHPKIVALFSAYFEDVWQNSQKLKQGNKIDLHKIQQIEDALRLV